MQSRAPVARFLLRRCLYLSLLVLGTLGLMNLLLADLQAFLEEGVMPAAGELSAATTPITQGASMDGFGAWSPEGKEIAFMRDGQILVTDASGKKTRVLTSEPNYWDANPVWRPDGKAIAFVRTGMNGDRAEVAAQDVGRGKPRTIAREAGPIGYLAWSPDARAIYFTTRDRVMRVDTATGTTSQLFSAPKGWELLSGGIAVARDGQSVVFGAGPRLEEGVQYDLWRLPVGSRQEQPQRLTTRGGIMPAFDPTGNLIAYRNPRQETGIWILNTATRAAERILADEARAMYFHPSFSPDGRRLVVSRLLLAPPPSRGRGGFTSNLYLHTLEGSGRER